MGIYERRFLKCLYECVFRKSIHLSDENNDQRGISHKSQKFMPIRIKLENIYIFLTIAITEYIYHYSHSLLFLGISSIAETTGPQNECESVKKFLTHSSST